MSSANSVGLNPYQSPALPPLPPMVTPDVAPRPWGPWATLAWGVAAAIVFLGVQTLVSVAFTVIALAKDPDALKNLDAFTKQLEQNGLLLAVATWTSLLPTIAVLLLAVWIRKWRFGDYL